jgi:hypothetical protein
MMWHCESHVGVFGGEQVEPIRGSMHPSPQTDVWHVPPTHTPVGAQSPHAGSAVAAWHFCPVV